MSAITDILLLTLGVVVACCLFAFGASVLLDRHLGKRAAKPMDYDRPETWE